MTQRNEREESRMLDIPVRLIQMIHDRPRRILDPEVIERMKSSLATAGQLQPIGVRRHGNAWTLIFGYLRLHAALQLGWPTIRAVEYPEIENHDLLDLALWANQNLHYVAPTLDEIAITVTRLIDARMTPAAIAIAFGQTEEWVTGMASICRNPTARCLIEIGRLSDLEAWHAFMALAPGDRKSLLDSTEPITVKTCAVTKEKSALKTELQSSRIVQNTDNFGTRDLWSELPEITETKFGMVMREKVDECKRSV